MDAYVFRGAALLRSICCWACSNCSADMDPLPRPMGPSFMRAAATPERHTGRAFAAGSGDIQSTSAVRRDGVATHRPGDTKRNASLARHVCLAPPISISVCIPRLPLSAPTYLFAKEHFLLFLPLFLCAPQREHAHTLSAFHFWRCARGGIRPTAGMRQQDARPLAVQ